MHEFSFSSEEQQLADNLRHEAQDTQPRYSDSHHERIMQAVRAEQRDEITPASVGPRTKRSGKIAAALSLSVISLAAILIAAFTLRTTNKPSDMTDTNQFNIVIKESKQDELPTDSEPLRQEWQDLSDDAQIAMGLVTDTFPIDILSSE